MGCEKINLKTFYCNDDRNSKKLFAEKKLKHRYPVAVQGAQSILNKKRKSMNTKSKKKLCSLNFPVSCLVNVITLVKNLCNNRYV